MAGTVTHGSGAPQQQPVDGTLYLRADGLPEFRVGSRWAAACLGPQAGVRVFEDFLLASGGSLPAPWGTQDTSAAGTPTLAYSDDAAGGQFVLKLAADNEAEAISLYFADQLVFDSTKKPVFKCRVKLEPDVTGAGGELGDGDAIVIGLASARNATLDNVAAHAWFRLQGSASPNKNILVESDDGTTDDDDNDTGSDWVANTWIELAIDMSDLAAIGFYIDGVKVAQLAASAMTGNLQPFVEVTKAAAANNDHRLTVDWIDVSAQR